MNWECEVGLISGREQIGRLEDGGTPREASRLREAEMDLLFVITCWGFGGLMK